MSGLGSALFFGIVVLTTDISSSIEPWWKG